MSREPLTKFLKNSGKTVAASERRTTCFDLSDNPFMILFLSKTFRGFALPYSSLVAAEQVMMTEFLMEFELMNVRIWGSNLDQLVKGILERRVSLVYSMGKNEALEDEYDSSRRTYVRDICLEAPQPIVRISADDSTMQ